MSTQALRGMKDLLGDEIIIKNKIYERSVQTAQNFGFAEIETPILEKSSLFLRTLGDSSDVVAKQMYLFTDKGGDEVVLRPEGTAGAARAFISLGLSQFKPIKLFYRGPMFRYERPQKGRLRQFHQFGAEIMGTNSHLADVEIIHLGAEVLRDLGVLSKTTLHLNTLGDAESRDAYRANLVSYLTPFKEKLSEDSQRRLEQNPLRILDTKDPGDLEIVKGAPKFSESLNETSKEHIEKVKAGLKTLEIDFVMDEKLVRGFDYYSHTVFEFISNEIGSQSAVLAGGRYNGLIQELGGPETPSVGWAYGLERMQMLTDIKISTYKNISIIPLTADDENYALKILAKIRQTQCVAHMEFSGDVGKRIKKAAKFLEPFAVFVSEKNPNSFGLKNLSSGEQSDLDWTSLVNTLKK